MQVFDAIDRHGPLPSHYLYEFTKHLRRDRTHLQNRLTEFYHGDRGGAYLVRPPQQFASYGARYQHLVYGLSVRARRILAERTVQPCFIPKRSDPFVHQLMGACVGASIELTAHRSGLRFISQHEIFARADCVAGQAGVDPLAMPVQGLNATVVPDALFGLEYPGAGFRFFAVEIDRNTESIERRRLGQASISRKVASYLAALREGAHRAWWGVPVLHVLIVTTNATHAANILDHIERQGAGALSGRFLVTTAQSFGANWAVPSDLLSDLVEQPWQSVNGPKHIGIVER